MPSGKVLGVDTRMRGDWPDRLAPLAASGWWFQSRPTTTTVSVLQTPTYMPSPPTWTGATTFSNGADAASPVDYPKLPGSSLRSRQVWYTTTTMDLNLPASDETPRVASLYLYDYASIGRQSTVAVRSADGSTTYDTLAVGPYDVAPSWVPVLYRGAVQIRVTRTVAVNSSVSGILFFAAADPFLD